MWYLYWPLYFSVKADGMYINHCVPVTVSLNLHHSPVVLRCVVSAPPAHSCKPLSAIPSHLHLTSAYWIYRNKVKVLSDTDSALLPGCRRFKKKDALLSLLGVRRTRQIGGNTFIWKVGKHSLNNATLETRRTEYFFDLWDGTSHLRH